jgi:uncharacterized protein (DUF2252 family)
VGELLPLALRPRLRASRDVRDRRRRRARAPSRLRVVVGGWRLSLGDDLVAEVAARILDTIPPSKKLGSLTYSLKDVVGKSGFGIGSAGLPAYNLLVEGHTEALENDVVLTMKQGNIAAPSRIVDDERCRSSFDHHGHRTAVSQRALQAYADPWLGWTALDQVGFVVAEYSPYETDLDWSSLSEPDEMAEVLEQLGRATAKVHCVSDVDDDSPLVEFQVEDAICAAVSDRVDEFVADLTGSSVSYAAQVRQDHALFVDAFRNDRIEGVPASVAKS